MYFFVDNSLAITDSIVDYYRRPKQGYTATRRAMQPICVLMDWPNDYYTDGDIIKLQTYVINDTHMAFPSTVLRWKIYNNEHEIFISDKKIVDMLGDDKITAGLIKWEITKNIDPGDYYVKLELELSTQECVENNYILKIIN